jgi:hypothetical protein
MIKLYELYGALSSGKRKKKTVFGVLKLVLSWFSLELTTIWHVDVDIDLEQLGRM